MSYPLRRGEIWTESEDGIAVYLAETDSLHVLNPTAFAIWELCDGETTPEEIALAVAELTGMNAETAADAVTSTIEDLQRLGLVVD